MRTKILGLLALLFTASPAFAYLDADGVNQLNTQFGSIPRQVQLGTILGAGLLKQARFVYDFSTDGGTVATIVALKTADKIPANSVMLYGVIDVITAVTSSGSGTLGFQCSAGGDIVAATAVGSLTLNALIVGKNDWTAANMKRNAGICTPVANIATAALTAGKVVGHVFYVVDK